jgi:HEAT repeat protein
MSPTTLDLPIQSPTETLTMTTKISPPLAVATLATAAASTLAANTVDQLVNRIRSDDDDVRGDAWQNAGPAGAPAIQPLAALMTDSHFEIARSARRAIWNIVYHAGRPNASQEAASVEKELIALLSHPATPVRREALWMLSKIAGNSAVQPMAQFLNDPELREDARCSIQRIPGKASLQALQRALKTAPEEFRYALAESLRARGEKVSGYPSRKLEPAKARS